MKKATMKDKFDTFVYTFINFIDNGGILFLGVLILLCIYFFGYRQLPVIDLREKEVETKPQIEQVWKDGRKEKTFFCKYENVKPTETYSVTVKLSQYGTKTKEYFNTSTYTISYKPKKEKGYVRIIVPLSDNLRKTDATVDCYYECDFTFLEELKEE